VTCVDGDGGVTAGVARHGNEHDPGVPFTRGQVQRVGDWVEHSGRRLAYIYATHGRVHQSVVLIVCTTLCRARTVG
jgi:hypothetical protein